MIRVDKREVLWEGVLSTLMSRSNENKSNMRVYESLRELGSESLYESFHLSTLMSCTNEKSDIRVDES